MTQGEETSPLSPRNAESANMAVQWLLGAILFFAPLLRIGQSALTLPVLETLSVLLLAVVLWRPRGNLVAKSQALALTLLITIPVLYLLPLPATLVEWLPGRQPYLDAQMLLDGGSGGGMAHLSLNPSRTESVVLFLLLPVAVFLGTRVLSSTQTLQLVLLVLGVAVLLPLLGLIQYGAGVEPPLLQGMSSPGIPDVRGTYASRNRFAGLLGMTLPFALALMFFTVRRRRRDPRSETDGRATLSSAVRGRAPVVYGAVALLLLVGEIFTRSLSGIALSALTVLLSAAAFSWRLGGSNVFGRRGTVVALTAALAIATSMLAGLSRLSSGESIQHARRPILSATLDGISAFLPVGSGPGTYRDVFPAFQPIELGRWHIDHAQNDYLEWLFDGGLPAALLILFLLALYVRHWSRVWTAGQWSRHRFVQVAAGIGLLVALLDSLVDCNLHVPTNITFFAFLAGVFFAEPATRAEPGRRRSRRTTPDFPHTPAAPPVPEGQQSSPPDQIPNPFLD
jgi:O-antigen ligase